MKKTLLFLKLHFNKFFLFTFFFCNIINAQRVLILKDQSSISSGVQALHDHLEQNGMAVDFSDFIEYSFIGSPFNVNGGVSKTLADYDVIVHMNGESFSTPMSSSGQTAIMEFVRNGGGYLGGEWLSYERNNHVIMQDLILLERLNGVTERLNFSKVSGISHPITDNLPSSFLTSSLYGRSPGRIPTALQPYVTTLMTSPFQSQNYPSVTIRELDRGRVVFFDHTVGVYGGTPYLNDNNMLELYLSSIRWLSGGIDVTGVLCVENNSVNFNVVYNNIQDPINSYSWSITDGTTFSSSNILNKVFSTSGDYTVTVTLGLQSGGTKTFSRDFKISATPSAANAGNDVSLNSGVTATSLTPVTPIVGSGVWSRVSGPNTPTISQANNVANLTGLINGTYVFRWTVSNGTCSPSLDDVTVSVGVGATTPSAPTNLTATPENGQAQISFTAGADGGAAITNYEYSINNGINWVALNPADATSPITIPGLANGTQYSIQIRAVNSVGAGAASNSISVIPDINLASLGGITIVNTTGAAENSGWSYSNGTILPTSSAAVTINASDVVDKLALGNLTIGASSIDINETVNYATNTNGITFKTTGNIVLAPSKLVTTNGGHVVLWSNADGEATNGGIFLKQGSSIVTAGGHVWLGGGNTATTWNGLTVGNGYAVSGRSVSDMRIDMWKPAIGFDQVTLSTAGGNIYIAGQRNENSIEGAGFINYSGTGTLIDAGSGTIVLKGYNTGTGAGLGVMTGLHPGSYSGRFVVKSSNATAVNAIAIEGSTTVSTQPAVLIENHTRLISSATSNGGAISISGVSTNNALSIGTVWGPGTLDVLSASGSINVNLGNNPLSIFGASSFFRLGSIQSDTDVPSSSANVVVTSNNVSWAGSVPIRTSGTLTVTPTNGNSFASAFNTTALNYTGISGLTIGNTSNTSAITIGSATSVAGPITVYGGNITLDDNIDTSTGNANGDILLKATGAIVQNATRTITTNGGDVIFWADADGNNAGDIFFNPGGAIATNSGHLWLGGGSGTATWNGLTVGDGYAVGDVPRSVQSFTHYNGITIQGTNIQTAGGHIQMRGKGKAGDFTGSNFSGGMYLLDAGSMNSGGGTIDIQTLSNTGTGQKYGLYNLGPYTFAPGSGNLTITGDASASSSGTTNLTGSGVFIWTSVSPISSSGAISITGKKSSTAGTFGVDIRTPITTTAGNITVSGDVVNVMANVSASGNVSYDASVSLTQTAVVTANGLSLNGAGNFTLNNISNNITTLAGGNNTTKLGSVSFTDASGGLTIGTVGANSGLTASGTISVETLADNLTISNNITTDNTTANAITINAGKSAAIGTATGGNIVLSGTPTITTGTGGIAKLFSGEVSTPLTAFVGGLSNTRDGVDETTTTFSPALTSGLYALYRASVPVTTPSITSFTPEVAGNGETVTITGTGFTGVTVVKLGNTNATSFTVVSDTEITAVVGNGASGSVYVQNAAGNDSEAGFIFKVAEYKFENNALDSTEANLDGTVVGTANYLPGASGNAICFTSTNASNATTVQNYLTLPSNLIRGRGANFTISLRFKTATFGGILGYQNSGVGAGGGQYVPILYVQQDGKLSANLWQASPVNAPLRVLSTNRVDDGNWHKVEFSAAPGSITVYIDGVLAGTSTGTIDHLSMNFNQLGAVNTAGPEWTGVPVSGWLGFNGCIDEFIILDKSLTATQINQVTALPQPTITSFTPTTASAGQTITITGTNFTAVTSVKIGGVEVQSFVVVSPTQITAVLASATANGSVEVITAAGTASATGFTLPNSAPTNISLSATSIDENNAVNAVVGTLTTSDADSGDTHNYSLVSGSGDTDNTSFTISGNQLRASVAFDFETKASYSVRIKTTDAAGLSFEKEFVINVLDLVENLAPTNISLSATSINENNAINAVVGSLTTTDTDSGDTHTYTLVSGLGATDNTSFTISGNQLRASVAFDFETKASYSVRIKTIDASGLSFEKAFTILINNVNETPVLSSPQSSIVAIVGLPITPFVISNATSGTTTYAISPALPAGMLFNTTTGSITGTPTVAKATITYTITATTTDGSASLTFTLFVDQDSDRDGILDSIDTDDDGDTILDINDAFPLNKNEWKDTDGDGIGDNADTDDDNDGILDVCDVDVNGDGIPDNGVDMDGDGIIDSCDTDRDGDGVNNTSDNCPDLPNTDQADRDRDGKGDVCDTTELNVSEGLTPNGDGINDTWAIYNLENYPGSIVRVFNANGKEVFYSNNYQNDWNGNYQGSSEMLPVGSYLYQIDLSGNGSIDVQGWLYITK